MNVSRIIMLLAASLLAAAACRSPDPIPRYEARAIDAWMLLLGAADERTRRAARDALRAIGTPAVLPLAAALDTAPASQRAAYERALAEFCPAALPALDSLIARRAAAGADTIVLRRVAREIAGRPLAAECQ